MNYLYLTSCYGYDWSTIKNWVVSFRNVNVVDDVVIITYTPFDEKTRKKLNEYNVCFLYERNSMYKRIVVERFRSYAKLLEKVRYDFVYLFDLADIFFQKNPNDWVEKKLKDKKIIAGSECIKYKDEKWAVNDFKRSFGDFFDFMKNKPTYNAGSFAGYSKIIRDISMNIYAMCNQHKYATPDQAAFNFLIQTAYKNETFFSTFKDGWCCQCGTTLDPTKMNVEPYNYSKCLLEKPPVIENYEVKNGEGEKFYIVHQYNRVPELNSHYCTTFEDR